MSANPLAQPTTLHASLVADTAADEEGFRRLIDGRNRQLSSVSRGHCT